MIETGISEGGSSVANQTTDGTETDPAGMNNAVTGNQSGGGPDSASDDTGEEVSDLAIGAELRRRREAKGISLRELARRVSVSASLVSQVERGLAMPSVSTLYSIACVLDLSLDQLFERAPNSSSEPGALTNTPFNSQLGAVEHNNERPIIRLADGICWERLAGDQDAAVRMIHSFYPPGTESCPADALIRHNGRETGFVIEGQLTVNIGSKTVVLGPGDTVTFQSTIPHRLANEGAVPVRAVWLMIESPRGDEEQDQPH